MSFDERAVGAANSVFFQLNGSAYTLIEESSFPKDNPSAWYRVSRAPYRRFGRWGRRYEIRMKRWDAEELALHYESIDEALSGLTVEERGPGDRDHLVAREAAQRIRKALGP